MIFIHFRCTPTTTRTSQCKLYRSSPEPHISSSEHQELLSFASVEIKIYVSSSVPLVFSYTWLYPPKRPVYQLSNNLCSWTTSTPKLYCFRQRRIRHWNCSRKRNHVNVCNGLHTTLVIVPISLTAVTTCFVCVYVCVCVCNSYTLAFTRIRCSGSMHAVLSWDGRWRQWQARTYRNTQTETNEVAKKNVTIGELPHANKHAYNRRNHSAIAVAVRKIAVPMVHLTTVLSLLSLFTILLINNINNTWSILTCW